MVIVADIGATKIALAIADTQASGVTLSSLKRYEAAAFTEFDGVLAEYLVEATPGAISSLCAAVAGPVMGNTCRVTNLKWDIDGDDVGRKFGIERVVLLNDLAASGYGLESIPKDRMFTVHTGDNAASGNRVLISPGTGLGESIIHNIDGKYIPIPSEGGHADFAPYDGTTVRLWAFLKRSYARVSVEHLLSGPGMFNIFRFLVGENGVDADELLSNEPKNDPAAHITARALDKDDPLSLRTVALFLDILASEAGNMALKGLSTGGVYIGGGIVPRIVSLIDRNRFATIFADRKPHRALLGKIPIHVVTDTNLPLYGAAAYIPAIPGRK